VSTRLLLDNSAWVRIFDPSISEARADQIADEFGEERIAVCLPFLLEAGYSARSGNDHEELLDELGSIEVMPIGPEVELRALDAQAQLARVGHHRIPPVDIIIAALADRHSCGVLHYDADYDVLLEKTDLDFSSDWLMPRGSLD
jgi:predicted nucleic acid-binding protein